MDTYNINENDDIINIIVDPDNQTVEISESEVAVTESIDDVKITVLNDSVSVIDSDDSVTIGEGTDEVNLSFEGGVSQTTVVTQNISEDDVPYTEEIDFVNDDVIYKGYADAGTTMDQALWRIQKITFINDEGDVRKRYANDDSAFIHIWNDRATYTYPNI